MTAAARPAYEIFRKPFLRQGVPCPFSSAALLVLPDGRQWYRRVPPPPPSCCRQAPLLQTRNAFHSSSAEPVGAAGLRRNIAEQLRNVELELLHVLAEAARSSIPASLPTPPAWLYGSAETGPLPSDSLLAKIRCRRFLSIADPIPSPLRYVVGSSRHRCTPFCGRSELAVPGRGCTGSLCATAVHGRQGRLPASLSREPSQARLRMHVASKLSLTAIIGGLVGENQSKREQADMVHPASPFPSSYWLAFKDKAAWVEAEQGTPSP